MMDLQVSARPTSDLDPPLVLAAAERIRSRLARTAADIIAVGEDLLLIKQAVGHGRFLSLITEFGMSADTARRFMNVASRLGAQIPHGAGFEPTALYLLAARSTPESVRVEVLKRAQAGERVGSHVVTELLAAAKRAGTAPSAAPRRRRAAEDAVDVVLGLEDHDLIALDQHLAAASLFEFRKLLAQEVERIVAERGGGND